MASELRVRSEDMSGGNQHTVQNPGSVLPSSQCHRVSSMFSHSYQPNDCAHSPNMTYARAVIELSNLIFRSLHTMEPVTECLEPRRLAKVHART
jgi:hypothetical protein